MLPIAPNNDAMNSSHIDAVCTCQLLQADPAARVCCSNFTHLISNQFSLGGTLARVHTPFDRGVPAVVSGGADGQMGGVHAGTVIAFVEAVQTRWYRAVSKFICNAVGFVENLLNIELAVTCRAHHANPGPAGIGATALVNVSPKAICHRTVSDADLMPVDIAYGLALDVPAARVSTSCKWSWRAAATFAESWGIVYHGDTYPSHIRCGHGRGCFEHRPAIFMPNYSIEGGF
jgi:hypothetical protein